MASVSMSAPTAHAPRIRALLMLLVISVAALYQTQTDAFSTPAFACRVLIKTSPACTTSSAVTMGIFDKFQEAFSNAEYAAPPEGIKATARHILVKSPSDAQEVMKELEGGGAFASLASRFSTCPSGARGGSLGSFSPGTMVREFDQVVFSPDTLVGEIVGPVETQFGYHLIIVDKRTGV